MDDDTETNEWLEVLLVKEVDRLNGLCGTLHELIRQAKERRDLALDLHNRAIVDHSEKLAQYEVRLFQAKRRMEKVMDRQQAGAQAMGVKGEPPGWVENGTFKSDASSQGD